MSCIIPEYAIGIRSWRAHASDAFAQPRCCKHAMHGIAIGEWIYQDGKKVTIWERITP